MICYWLFKSIFTALSGILNGNPISRWITASRGQTSDATVESINREEQRLKDEDTTYENDIKIKILDAALAHVDLSGWSKQALAQGRNLLCCYL